MFEVAQPIIIMKISKAFEESPVHLSSWAGMCPDNHMRIFLEGGDYGKIAIAVTITRCAIEVQNEKREGGVKTC